MSLTRKLLLFLILIILVAPAVQKKYQICNEKKVVGYFKSVPYPEPWKISAKTWISSEYQDNLATQMESHIGFRNHLFILHNQYDWSFFGRTHAEGFIAGKDGMLFEEDYIREYNGDFFIGKSTLDKKLVRLRELTDTLGKRGTKLLVIIEPGKATFFPEYIPDAYHPDQKKITNYDYITGRMKELSMPFLDLNRYFLMMKDTSVYPLFPKYGMHWSIYGMACMVDTFARFIEKQTGTGMPSFRIGKVEVTDSSRYTDNDIGELLNLICPVYRQNVAYPEMIFGPHVQDSLKVLVIADSYYASIERFVVPDLFGKDTYWYYNSKVYPYTIETDNPVWVDKSKLDSTLVNYDLILLMSSEINLHCFFWGFADEGWLAFNPHYPETPAYLMENKIRNEREWFRFIVEKAKKEGRTLESVISGDAAYIVRN